MLLSWPSPLRYRGPMPPVHAWEDAGGVPRAHGVDSLCRGDTLPHQPPLKRIKRRTRARGDPDLRIEALDMVVGGLGRDLELAGGFLRGIAGRDQPQDLDLARGQA